MLYVFSVFFFVYFFFCKSTRTFYLSIFCISLWLCVFVFVVLFFAFIYLFYTPKIDRCILLAAYKWVCFLCFIFFFSSILRFLVQVATVLCWFRVCRKLCEWQMTKQKPVVVSAAAVMLIKILAVLVFFFFLLGSGFLYRVQPIAAGQLTD